MKRVSKKSIKKKRKQRRKRVTRKRIAGGPKKDSCDVNKFKEIQRRLAEGPRSAQYSSMRKEELKQKDKTIL